MTAPARSCPACHTPLPEEARFCLQCGASTPTDSVAASRALAAGAVDVAKVRGALADRYAIERVLGQGGMATVYLAEDLKHHRKVAVKVMRPEFAATLGSERFLREIEIAAKLSHPHILPVHDSGEADGLLYYVMPWIDGESLRERLLQQGALPVDQALRLAREVAEALEHAHQRGIVHRDVKPANILLGGGHALVGDFGIARAMGSGAALTQTGLSVGTPQYMAPEQAMGEATVDARADVYAVGGVLYEMLAGQPPYTGPTPQAILAKSLTGPPPALETIKPGIPGSVSAVVERAMARDATDRYQSAAALVGALDEALEAARSGTRAALPPAPATARVVTLFLVAAASVLAVSYALVRQVGLPGWMFPLAATLMLVGLPIILVTGRVEARRSAGGADRGLRRGFTWRNAVVGGVVGFAAWGALAAALVMRLPLVAGLGGTVRLAVLPFENVGPADNAYFADGIADQVRGKLTSLAGFQVIARSSSMQYRQTTKSPQDIGRELGVPFLLTATVRMVKTGDSARVEVMPELIDARSGSATWQQNFAASVTDVFRVQEAIASQVASALGVALGSRDRTALAQRPTQNLAAYDAFLRGEAILLSLSGADPAALRRGASYYDQAVALDPSFGHAWARLAQVRSSLYFLSVPSPAEAEAARRAVERAQSLSPRAPVTFQAVSLYGQYVLRDPARAREAAEQGLAASPSDVDLMVRLASFEADDRPEEALRMERRATELDPRSVPSWAALGNLLIGLRRYGEALQALDQGLVVDPTSFRLHQLRALVFLGQGDLPGARRSLAAVPRDLDQAALVAYLATYNDLYWVLTADQQTLLLTLPPSAFDNDRATWGSVMMQVHGLRGDQVRARAYADSARAAFEAELRDAPNDPQLHSLHGLALAYLGRTAEAVAEGRRGLELGGTSFTGTYLTHQLIRIYVRVGQPELALDQIENLLRRPYFLSPGRLRVDPDFVPLKGNPRFERLIAGR
jgi:TolB-like protein/tRNA A-37 threonylcarbamoyl transferase component Bud32